MSVVAIATVVAVLLAFLSLAAAVTIWLNWRDERSPPSPE